MPIHPTAVIADGALLADDIEIGPYAIIDPGVKIGAGTRIAGHAQIVNRTRIGAGCEIGHGAVIGANPQDKSFSTGITSSVAIGDGNIFREHVTIHRSSSDGNSTRIGDRNYFMVGSHVGHDTVIGNDNTLANGCLLGGHVTIGNFTFLGGGSAFHQFVRVGDMCMVKGLTAITQDVPPFVIMSGSGQVRGLNNIGMRRSGFSKDTRASIKLAFCVMLRQGLNLDDAYSKLAELDLVDEALTFVDFFRTPSRKGICHV